MPKGKKSDSETKAPIFVDFCAYSGQLLKGKQLLDSGNHMTRDGITHRLVRWANRRYEWVGDQLKHRVTGQLFDIHPNAVANAAIVPQIEEHEDPNEPKKPRKVKKVEADSQTEATEPQEDMPEPQPAPQDESPAKDEVPTIQPADEASDVQQDEPELEEWPVQSAPAVEEFQEDEVLE